MLNYFFIFQPGDQLREIPCLRFAQHPLAIPSDRLCTQAHGSGNLLRRHAGSGITGNAQLFIVKNFHIPDIDCKCLYFSKEKHHPFGWKWVMNSLHDYEQMAIFLNLPYEKDITGTLGHPLPKYFCKSKL